MNLKVSVLIPTYNRAAYLMQAIDSVLSQTRAPDEVIVVDDGSTDSTAELMARAPAKVRYHRIANSGASTARNVAVSMAQSPFLAFCDSDDLWKPDKLEKQMELHSSNPGMRLSFTNFSIVSDGRWATKSKFEDAPRGYFDQCNQQTPERLVADGPMYTKLLQFQPIFPSTYVMTKQFFNEVGGFNDALTRIPCEDLEFTLRCAQHAPIGILTEPLVGIRKHSSNLSGDNLKTTIGEVDILNFALLHHGLDEGTKMLVREQIAKRRIEASYDAFSEGKFEICKDLLTAVPASYLTPRLRLKLLLSKTPPTVANFCKKFLTVPTPTTRA